MTKVSRNFVAGKMNKVVDERLLPPGEYVDAVNVRMGSTENSEIGVIENSKGNVELTSLMYIDGTLLSTDARCIGALDDSANETVYWFVHDPKFVIPGNPARKLDMIVSYNVFTNALIYHVISIDDGSGVDTTLNFNPKYLITGVDKIEDLLFFTDDYNPPRFINVKRTYANPSSLNVDYNGQPDLLKEAILVVKRPPMEAPVIFPLSNSGEENFMQERFVCFAYRYRYADGEYSATSQWSQPSFIPKTFQFNATSYLNSGMQNSTNQVTIEYNSGGELVVGVDLLFKEMDKNYINVIEKLDKVGLGLADNTTYQYTFSNSKIYTVLPESELLRLYDNVPHKAKAQTIMGNRLMYGNYEEGYDLRDKDGGEIRLTYYTTQVNGIIGYTDIPFNINRQIATSYTLGGNTKAPYSGSAISIDMSNIIGQYGGIPAKSSLTINFAIKNKSYWSSVGATLTDVQNDTDIFFSVYLNSSYPDVTSLVNSPEFKSAIGQSVSQNPILPVWLPTPPGGNTSTNGSTLTDFFNASIRQNATSTSGIVKKYFSAYNTVALPVPSTITPSTLGDGLNVYVDPINPNGLVIELLPMAFFGGPENAPTQYVVEYYEVLSADANLLVLDQTQSLHSNRGYEIGIVYMDDFSRSTTVLVSQDNTEYIPCSASDTKNSIRVTIPTSQVAPYWATKYKFVCRADREGYETIYCPVYFYDADNDVAYFLLEGENARKVNEGQRLIVKADTNGPTDECITVTVLEKEAKGAGFISGSPPEGVYMKTSVTEFSVIQPPGTNVDFGSSESITTQQGAYPATSRVVSLGTDPNYTDLEVKAGAIAFLHFKFSRTGTGDGDNLCERRNYTLDLEIRASRDYTNFYDFFVGENIGSLLNSGSFDVGAGGSINNVFIPSILSVGGVPPFNFGTNHYQFVKVGNGTGLKLVVNSGTPACGDASKKRSRVEMSIKVFGADAACIFETEPTDTIPDIFFENDLSFPIGPNGEHLKNSNGPISDVSQNFTLNIPADLDTGFFNCYAFGNGVESYKALDSLIGSYMTLGNRVNSVAAQDYRKVRRFSDITYSGAYNPESNVNKLNEFNLGLLNYKNLEVSFGKIYILDGRQTDVLVLQEDKISYVLAGKNLLSDAAAGGAITSVPEVLGTQIARPEKYGISFNPESYVQWGYDRFFTDVKRGAVIQLRGDSYSNEQLKVVSEMGMRTWFRDTFINSFNTQKLGGFDPYMNEYVLSGNNIEIAEEISCSDCGQTQSLLLEQYTGGYLHKKFCVNLGQYNGEVTIKYNVVVLNTNGLPVELTATYNGTTFGPHLISTTGSGGWNAFFKTNASDVVDLDISYPVGKTVIMITVECPFAQKLTVVEVVYTDPIDTGETIHTEFYNYNPNYTAPTQSNLVTFANYTPNPYGVLVSRYNMVTSYVGAPGFPSAGDTMRLATNKILGDTFNFDPSKNKFKWYRSTTFFDGNSPLDMVGLSLVSSPIVPSLGSSPYFYGNFTVPAGVDGDYLYLIWDLRTAVPANLCYEESDSGDNYDFCCDCKPCQSECAEFTFRNKSSLDTATIVFPSGTCGNQYVEAVLELDPDEFVDLCVVNDNTWYIESGDIEVELKECGCTRECQGDCQTYTIIPGNGVDADVTYKSCETGNITSITVPADKWRDICVEYGDVPGLSSGASAELSSDCGCCSGKPCWYVLIQAIGTDLYVSYYDCSDQYQSAFVQDGQSINICVSKRLSLPAPVIVKEEVAGDYLITILNSCNCLWPNEVIG